MLSQLNHLLGHVFQRNTRLEKPPESFPLPRFSDDKVGVTPTNASAHAIHCEWKSTVRCTQSTATIFSHTQSHITIFVPLYLHFLIYSTLNTFLNANWALQNSSQNQERKTGK